MATATVTERDTRTLVNYQKDGNIAVLELNDPPANTYTHEMMRQLDDCIIRARFLNRITEAYERNADLPLLLADDYFTEAVSNSVGAWRRVVAGAAENGIPTPAFSSSLAYYDGIRAERLPAALIQAQRDFFGAHTYHRIDNDGSFHTEWSADRTESQVGEAFKQEVPAAKESEKAHPTPE